MGSKNYVNQKAMHLELIKYHTARQEGRDPQISNYIGECISLICKRLGTRKNFSSYTYNMDMVSDGILHCVAAVPKYDPNKNDNPFGYFSRVAWHAFIQRIQEEKKQNYIKHKNYQKIHMFDELSVGYDDSHGDISDNDLSNKVIGEYETKIAETKAKKKNGSEK